MFTEPEIIASFDRSYGDKKEELRLERGDYQGKPTFCLRLYWQAGDGAWRWASQKPTQSGKCWERMNLKARELKAIGEALIQASAAMPTQTQERREPAPERRKQTNFSEPETDDIPF